MNSDFYRLKKENSKDFLLFSGDECSNIVMMALSEEGGYIIVKMDSVTFDETCDILDLHDTAKYSPDTFNRTKVLFERDGHMLKILVSNSKNQQLDNIGIGFELTMLRFRNIVKRIHRGLIAREAAELVRLNH